MPVMALLNAQSFLYPDGANIVGAGGVLNTSVCHSPKAPALCVVVIAFTRQTVLLMPDTMSGCSVN